MKVSKVGGGYGIKLTRACLSGVACSLAAHLLQKPVKMVFNIETMMEGIGKRYENYTEYEVTLLLVILRCNYKASEMK